MWKNTFIIEKSELLGLGNLSVMQGKEARMTRLLAHELAHRLGVFFIEIEVAD